MKETSKSLIRRLNDIRYATRYFVGSGIDIGAGDDSLGKYAEIFPLISNLTTWDTPQGDAQYMQGIAENSFNFIHSSHCLEHINDPYEAFDNWIKICIPGGHMVITVPDEDLYEQGVWPSSFSLGDHKTSWTILKQVSWSPSSINVIEFLYQFRDKIEVLKVEQINQAFLYEQKRLDQTYHSISECAIEFIVRKKTTDEILRKGRLPKLGSMR